MSVFLILAHKIYKAPGVFLEEQAVVTMGRIKTKPVKSAGDTLYEKYPEQFGNFEKNKLALPGVAEVRSKKIRNILAGYLTQKAKRRA
jgi:small subunit ribosomal protein S17e